MGGLERVTWMPARADLIGGLVAAVGSLLAAAFSLQLWRAHLHVPLVYGSDALLTQILIKQVISGGWVWHIHGLGAPSVTELYDFPVATDALNFLVIKALGLLTADSAKVMNLFFLLTFPVEAIVGYAVLRWLGVSTPTSVVCAILFADAPYHLFRGESHLLLSSYASVPLGTYMIVTILDGRDLFRRRARAPGAPAADARARVRSWLTRRNLLIAIMCIAIGSLGVYYATFTALLVGVAALVTAATRRSWRPIAQGALVVLLVGGMSFVNDIPAALYRQQHGADLEVAHRPAVQSELFALKLVEMVLPVPGHRIGALSRLRARYDTTTPVPSEDSEQSLGIVASLGFVWMLLVGLAAIAGTDRRTLWLRRTRQLAFATVTAFLIGTMGGFSSVLAYVVAAQLRGWNRISIFIAFFALASVGLALDVLGRRVLASRRFRSATGSRSWGRVLLLGALALLLAVGIYDQSSYEVIPPYALNDVAYGQDGLFVHAIQRIMPRDAMIFQLPYMPFPESLPVGNIPDYDPGRGYVHTTDGLRWSYGAMTGRPQDWEVDTPGLPVSTLLDAVTAAGFSGLWIDRQGYQDGGAALQSEVQQVLGTPPLISRDGRFLFYDLRPLAAKLRQADPPGELSGLSTALLNPPAVTFGNGFYALDANNARWALPTAQASIVNSTSHSQPMVFSATVQTRAPGHWKLTMIAPNGATTHFTISPKPRAIRFEFIDPPGTHNLTMTTKAPIVPAIADPRQLAVYYTNPVIQRGAFSPFLPGRLKTSFKP